MSGQCESRMTLADTEWQCERDKGHDGLHGFCLDWIEFEDDSVGAGSEPKATKLTGEDLGDSGMREFGSFADGTQ